MLSLRDNSNFVSYQGSFRNDLYNGLGILIQLEQSFKGRFVDGFWTEGIYTYPNGEEYTGPLTRDRLRNGYGVMKYKSGDEYCGDFKLDLKQGQGILKLANNETIKGVWEDDKLIMGQQRFSDGVYFGSFDANMLPSGKGLFTYNDSDAVYQGSWKNGLQDGWGTFKDESSTFEGTWKEGQKVEGTLRYLDEQEEYIGTFIHGEKACGVLKTKNYTFSGEFLNSYKF